MGVLEAVLIALGVLFIIASFFVPEKLSNKEVEQIEKLSEAQLRVIVERKLKDAEEKIESSVDDAMGQTQEKAERLLEKESNEKIMAISEYSDTVLESINKTHNEVMFLYSMLNEKYDEMTNCVNQISNWKKEMDSYGHEMEQRLEEKREQILSSHEEEETPSEIPVVKEESNDYQYQKDEILRLYREGLSEVEIARTMGIGIGVVRLEIGLNKGEPLDEI